VAEGGWKRRICLFLQVGFEASLPIVREVPGDLKVEEGPHVWIRFSSEAEGHGLEGHQSLRMGARPTRPRAHPGIHHPTIRTTRMTVLFRNASGPVWEEERLQFQIGELGEIGRRRTGGQEVPLGIHAGEKPFPPARRERSERVRNEGFKVGRKV
jgi:hypothetical protein